MNLDELDINYFNNQWTAEISALVSYNEKVKFEEEDKFGDTSFEAVRTYSLFYDADKEQSLTTDFKDTIVNGI